MLTAVTISRNFHGCQAKAKVKMSKLCVHHLSRLHMSEHSSLCAAISIHYVSIPIILFCPGCSLIASVVKVTAHPTLTSPSFRGASPFGSGERPSPSSRCSVLCARADPRLHHLAGCAGVTQGYGLAQHHAVRVAPCPGHVPPLHGLLSDAQSEYTQSAR